MENKIKKIEEITSKIEDWLCMLDRSLKRGRDYEQEMTLLFELVNDLKIEIGKVKIWKLRENLYR